MLGCCTRVNFDRTQWMTLYTFIVVNFCNAMCVSMQAPFYPAEAEKKGCVPSEYGLVFGIFELTVFLVSPIIGANLNRMGMKATLNIGIGTVGVTSILFGLLDKVENSKMFLGLSFALRIVEACGNAGFLTGSFSMIACVFPDNVATMFAISETFFGIGMIVGPTVGGALYELGGFTLPFAALGSILVCAAIFVSFTLPNPIQSQSNPAGRPSMLQALKVPSIVMACYSVSCTAGSLGFLQATLEPHMREFQLGPLLMGSMFVVSGACYGISSPLWGMFCDRKTPKLATLVGSIFIIVSFSLLGPLPFLPFKKSIGIIIVGLFIHGIGLGAEVVAGFADAHKQAILAGFPDTVDTYGLISGLWTSVFAFGAFIGPTVAGILFDAVGFPWATLFIIGTQLIVLAALAVFLITDCCKRRETPTAPVIHVIKEEDEEDEDSALLGGAGGDDEEAGPSGYGAAGGESHEQRRQRARGRRRRKYSEVVSGSVAGSMAKSISMAYPQFMMPGVANSYRNPPPSMVSGAAMAGSVADRLGADTDSLGNVPE